MTNGKELQQALNTSNTSLLGCRQAGPIRELNCLGLDQKIYQPTKKKTLSSSFFSEFLELVYNVSNF
jgi:hypothetical protein